MSLQSWREEFYPVPATETKPEEAVAHSLRKWEGLLPENLAKHRVAFINNYIEDVGEDEVFSFSDETCALCHHYLDQPYGWPSCKTCPLFEYLGERCDEKRSSPYSLLFRGNVMPMIEALRAIRQKELGT